MADVIKLAGDSAIEVDLLINDLISEMEAGINTLNGAMAGTIANLPINSDVARDLIELQKSMRLSGFDKIIGEGLNKSFTEAINLSGQLATDIHDEVFEFSMESLGKLKSLKQTTFNSVQDAAQTYLTKINNGLNTVRFGTGTKADVIKEINEKFGKTLANQAKTLLDTGVSGAKTQANVLLAQDNGIEKFFYAGSLIATSRPFCVAHLHQTKTIKEWDELNNGQIGPVSVFKGGYNCRHDLVGVI